MATIKSEDGCPDESSDNGGAPLGPDVLPYVDEDDPRIILWLNAEEWAKLPRKKSVVTSEQTPPEPLNDGAKPQVPLTKETKPQAAELPTSKPVKSLLSLDTTPLSKKTKFFTLNPYGPTRMPHGALAQPQQWRNIHSVIFGSKPGPRFIQSWDEETKAIMIKNSELQWQSEPPSPPFGTRKEPVSVAIFRHVRGGLWCEVESIVNPKRLFIMDPFFM